MQSKNGVATLSILCSALRPADLAIKAFQLLSPTHAPLSRNCAGWEVSFKSEARLPLVTCAWMTTVKTGQRNQCSTPRPRFAARFVLRSAFASGRSFNLCVANPHQRLSCHCLGVSLTAKS